MSHIFYDTASVMTPGNIAMVTTFFEGRTVEEIARAEKISSSHAHNIISGICRQTLIAEGIQWNKPRVTALALREYKDLILPALKVNVPQNSIKELDKKIKDVEVESLKISLGVWSENNIKFAIEVLEGKTYTEVAAKYGICRVNLNNIILTMCREIGQVLGLKIDRIASMRVHADILLQVLKARLKDSKVKISDVSSAIHVEPIELGAGEAYTDDNVRSIATYMEKNCVLILRAIHKQKYDEFLVTTSGLKVVVDRYISVSLSDIVKYLTLMMHHKFCIVSERGYYFIDGLLTPNDLILDCIESLSEEIENLGETRNVNVNEIKVLEVQPIEQVYIKVPEVQPVQPIEHVEIKVLEVQPIEQVDVKVPEVSAVTHPVVTSEEQQMNQSQLKVVPSAADDSLKAFTIKQIETLQYLSGKNPHILPFLKALSVRFGEKTKIFIDAVIDAAHSVHVKIEKYEVLEFFASLQTIGEERAGDEKLGTMLGETIEAKASFAWAKKNGSSTPYNVNTLIRVLSQ